MFTYVPICLPIVNIEKQWYRKSILKNMLKNDVSLTSVSWRQ